ncbi:hypothetical protein COT94_01100 [Candidatus Falkowbacteria bacterium CG10_big_fil_rev_8_21_14_0_10_37_14]|uniref:Sulfatase N-terminal domain-containing protein n=1 Tax=Candidatus Falkowbacteria bacterium CG10_big_fil_rev_8_21_14_0_10_37_14 TaxID=1974561 RepID=A0A2M6WU62_9BACT|nr:sulfatase-like hydrolase/transferase [Candidatus Falkowbacteria bacterium]PIT96271.1 MAG: hypothetical protein COT94_01100 [Candidatus Falkowbacteria bacterium CG10_big_fil_rev_8_21_14_0_10_37_14]
MLHKTPLLSAKALLFSRHLDRFLRSHWLPISLIIIFVLQSHLFNFWLKLPVHDYFIRRSIINFSFGVLIFGSSLLLKTKTKHLYLFLTSSVIGLFFIFQFLYHSYSGGFLQLSAIFYAQEGLTTFSTAKTLITYRLLLFIIGPFLVLSSALLSYYGLLSQKTLTKFEKSIFTIFIIFFTIFGYGYLLTREQMESGNLLNLYKSEKIYDIDKLVNKLGIINFFLFNSLFTNFHTSKVTPADKVLIETFSVTRPPANQNSNFGLLKNRNLIIIQVESLENAVINQKIYDQEITPNLNKLTKEALYFSNYYAPIGPGSTADAEFMILNSLYSLPDEVAFIKHAYNNYTALPKLLKDNGYHTYSFHRDASSFWNRANIYPGLGYEHWFDRKDYQVTRKIGPYDLSDQDFFDQTVPKLKDLPQPFMATLITLTSHTPFELPADLETLNIPADAPLNWLQYHYLQNIHYVDQTINSFIEQLKLTGLYNNSLILIYGDHSSFTGIAEALHFNNSFSADLQKTEVPLFILAPGTKLQGIKNQPTSHLDIYPTTANLLGIKPPASVFGHDIVNEKNSVVVSRNAISGTIKTIVTNDLSYQASQDGLFENGSCLEMPSKKISPVEICRLIYDTEKNSIEASDLMIKKDILK